MNFSNKFVAVFIVAFLLLNAVILTVATVIRATYLPKTNNNQLFELPIIHLNDFHARFEETSLHSTTCKPDMTNCIGGFSRLYTAITNLKAQHHNSIFLNAGDNFQGTIWYNVFKWNVTQYFLNMLPTDAITLGNHEFDDGVAGVVPFIKALNAPVVVANIDDSNEPSIQGLYQKSTIILRENKKIGIIGAILQTTNEIAKTDNLKFLNESEAVRAEAKRLKTEENCDIIIVLSHCGLDVDQIIAAHAGPYVNVIVGGHSHTFLYHGTDLPGPDIPVDDYPVTVTQPDGHQVLIVQASCYSKYLGFLTVFFDANNELHHWEGNPFYMSHDMPQDQHINELLLPWKQDIDAIGQTVLGRTKVTLTNDFCNNGDTNFGNFLTDAMVAAWVDKAEDDAWTYASIAFTNCGSIRTGMEIGNITYEDLLTAQPFGNTIDVVELRGDHLLETLEYAVESTWEFQNSGVNYRNMLQISGIHVIFNSSNPVGARVQDIKVLCRQCEVPKYEPVVKDQYYRIAMPDYLVNGGDGFTVINNNMRNHIIGEIDVDVISKYIEQQSPIIYAEDDRLIVVK